MECNYVHRKACHVDALHCTKISHLQFASVYIQNTLHYPEAPWHRPRPPSLPLRRRGQGYGPNQRSPGTTWLPGAFCDAAAAPLALCSLLPSSG